MKACINKISYIATLLFLSACIEPFDPPVQNKDVGFLVVDGYVNSSNHTATVRLTRAIPLSSTSDYPVVATAHVSIENAEGVKIPLIHNGDGLYSSTSPLFVTGKEYRLLIQTTDGKQFQSVVITTKPGASIDSVTTDVEEEGINVRLSTHDPSGSITYYRCDLVETWEYHSAYSSNFEFINGRLELRKFDERINVCYKTEASSAIATASTLDIEDNRISGHPVIFLEKLSAKLEYIYSVEVSQYSLDKAGYDYWEQMRVSSQTLGGLFDPQPARIKGNISAIGSDEPVIGFFDGGEVSRRRIFIRNRELPPEYQRYRPDPNCEELFADPVEALRLNGQLITSAVYEGIALIGYQYTTIECADCRTKGGVLAKPSFWP